MKFLIPENICYIQNNLRQQAYNYAQDVISKGGTVSFLRKTYSDYNKLIKAIHDFCDAQAKKEKQLIEQLNKPIKQSRPSKTKKSKAKGTSK